MKADLLKGMGENVRIVQDRRRSNLRLVCDFDRPSAIIGDRDDAQLLIPLHRYGLWDMDVDTRP